MLSPGYYPEHKRDIKVLVSDLNPRTSSTYWTDLEDLPGSVIVPRRTEDTGSHNRSWKVWDLRSEYGQVVGSRAHRIYQGGCCRVARERKILEGWCWRECAYGCVRHLASWPQYYLGSYRQSCQRRSGSAMHHVLLWNKQPAWLPIFIWIRRGVAWKCSRSLCNSCTFFIISFGLYIVRLIHCLPDPSAYVLHRRMGDGLLQAEAVHFSLL